jgi:hypothetical protein
MRLPWFRVEGAALSALSTRIGWSERTALAEKEKFCRDIATPTGSRPLSIETAISSTIATAGTAMNRARRHRVPAVLRADVGAGSHEVGAVASVLSTLRNRGAH